MTISETAKRIYVWLQALAAPDQLIELRCLGYRPPHCERAGVHAGFFDAASHAKLAREAAEATRYARGVYWTLNPLRESCLERSANRLLQGQRHLARDEDVLARRWLLIDVDPVRPAGVSSTDAELAHARQVVEAVADYLGGLGWAAPVYAHSGNGYHLYYRIDLPTVDGGLVQQCLHALAQQFDRPEATIDTSVFNPSRISKLPGTWSRKGKDTAARPHRQAAIITYPVDPKPVPLEMLEALASTAAPVARAQASVPIAPPVAAGDRGRILERARRYMQHVDGAVSGQHGHDWTFRAACILVQRFALTVDEAAPILEEWNAKCEPPWEVVDLLRKLREADEAPGPRGEFVRHEWASPASPSAPSSSPSAPGAPGQQAAGDAGPTAPGVDPSLLPWGNYFEQPLDEGPVLRVGHPVQVIASNLFRITDGWPRRVGRGLFAVRDHRPVWFRQSSDLFAWIGSQLPPLRENQLRWERGRDKVKQDEFAAHLQQCATAYDGVEEYPHWPPMPNHYYLHPKLPAPTGEALQALLARFCPYTEVDANLLLAFVLTLCWGGPIGARPAFILTGPEGDSQGGRGVGKSKVVHFAAQLFGGSVDFSTSEQLSNIHTRILSADALSKRVVLFDNVKTRRFSWGDLEALITAPTISGRQLYTGEGRRPNNLTWCITLNGVNLSRDLAQRAVIIRLARPRYSGEWYSQTAEMIEANRWQIIADALDILQVDTPPLAPATRWGEWERSVLARVPNPGECQRVMVERTGEADDDTEESDCVREAFVEALHLVGANPDTTVRRFTPQEAAEIVSRAIGGKPNTTRMLAYLAGLGIPEIGRMRSKTHRWVIWKGRDATDDTVETDFLS